MISVSLVRSLRGTRISLKDVERIASYVCKKEKVRDAELSFVIIDDGKIRTINKKFLGHDYSTDVITFPLEEKKVSAEIYINARQLKRQAKENGVTAQNEMTRLVVHGTLHAIGYDDTKSLSKKRMFAVQERYVEQLSLKKQGM